MQSTTRKNKDHYTTVKPSTQHSDYKKFKNYMEKMKMKQLNDDKTSIEHTFSSEFNFSLDELMKMTIICINKRRSHEIDIIYLMYIIRFS